MNTVCTIHTFIFKSLTLLYIISATTMHIVCVFPHVIVTSVSCVSRLCLITVSY